MALVMM